MILLTVLSRAADSITIAKVSTSRPSQGNLNFTVDGMGIIEAEMKEYIYTLEGIEVKEIFVEEGQKVKAKDKLLQLKTEDIEEKLDEIEKKIKEMDIQILQTKLDGTSQIMDPTNTASLAVEGAREEVEIAEEEVKEAEEDYLSAMEKKGETTLEEKEKACSKAKEEYENYKFTYDNGVLEAKEAVEAEEEVLFKIKERDALVMGMLEAYSRAYGEGEYEEKEKIIVKFMTIKYGEEEYEEFLIKKKEMDPSLLEMDTTYKNMSRQKDNLENALVNYYSGGYSVSETIREKALEEIRDFVYGKGKYEDYLKEKKEQEKKIKKEERKRDQTLNGLELERKTKEEAWKEAKEALKKVENGSYDYEAELKTEEAALKGAQKTLKAAERSLSGAQAEYNAALKEKSGNQMSEAKKQQILNRKLEVMEEDLRAQKEDAKELESLIVKKGMVTAKTAGTVEKILTEAGKKSTLEEVMVISTGSFGFTGEANEEEGQYISIGDEIQLWINNEEIAIDSTIESLKYSISETGQRVAAFTALLPEGEYMEGMSARFKTVKVSKAYRNLISLQAIRTDANNQKFVLILDKKKSVLGEQTIVRSSNVTVLENDSQNAAIEGVSGDIIVSSNKDIYDGDRVRLR